MEKKLEAILLSLVAVFAPIQSMILTVTALIVVDFITGIYAAYKREEKITSSGMRRSLSKFIVYEIGLMTGFLVETYLLAGSIPVVKMIAAAIGLTELKSINENLDSVLGESIFKLITQKLGSNNEVEDIIKK